MIVLNVLRNFPARWLLLPVVFFFNSIKAQLCTGSLGDPVVNITFGSGSNYNYTAPGSYGFVANDCPNDGYYTIINQTSNCFSNSWHVVPADHTGAGNFLLVNASYDPGDFFVQTVSDLCPNTTYEFAAWIMNVMRNGGSILPDITFSIETPGGVVLQSFNTGGIPVTAAPAWNQYGFFFTTPVGNSAIVLRITNNAPGGIGNDLAMDDITFRPCGSKIDAAINGNPGGVVDVCEGTIHSYVFNSGTVSGYVSPLYQWQLSVDSGAHWNNIPGATNLAYAQPPTSAPGAYWYRLTVIEASVAGIASCRIASEPLKINIHPNPVVHAGPDRIIIAGDSTQLPGEVKGEQPVFQWSPSLYLNNTSLLTPNASPPSDITYTLSAVSTYGCPGSDDVLVKAVAGIFVPTAFSPNGDGKNDVWEIPFLDPSYGGEVKVFNRWGQLIYRVKDAFVSWNGRCKGLPQPSGVYVYTVHFSNGRFKDMRGMLTLVR